MAQTKRKRRRKHRGTQAGTIDRSAARGGSHAVGSEQKSARERRLERLERPPTWRGALSRAAIAAVLFGLVVILAFGRPVAQGVVLTAFVLLLYVPVTYYTDYFLYRRRQRRKAAAAVSGRARGSGGGRG